MREEVVEQFVNQGNWFERKFRTHCDARYPTFKAALNLWLQSGGQTIVETGCVRAKDDYGAGNSTVLFAEVVSRYGGTLWSVDFDPTNVELADQLTSRFAGQCRCVLDDSVVFLRSTLPRQAGFAGRIDLLYLDSQDYPTQEIAARFGCRDEVEVRNLYPDLADDEIAQRHDDLVNSPQQHCLAELQAALPLLHGGSVVLIDDNDLPGGGKSRLAKRRLTELGWRCVLDAKQTLWLPPIGA